jgi:hypothetical protein
MKKTFTSVLAASFVAVAIVATPHRAHAAADSYLWIDGSSGSSSSSGSTAGGSQKTGSKTAPRTAVVLEELQIVVSLI